MSTNESPPPVADAVTEPSVVDPANNVLDDEIVKPAESKKDESNVAKAVNAPGKTNVAVPIDEADDEVDEIDADMEPAPVVATTTPTPPKPDMVKLVAPSPKPAPPPKPKPAPKPAPPPAPSPNLDVPITLPKRALKASQELVHAVSAGAKVSVTANVPDLCVGYFGVEGSDRGVLAACHKAPDNTCPATFDASRCTLLKPVQVDVTQNAKMMMF